MQECSMSKFIVITSINDPTQAVKEFSAMEDWQVIVVADLKTPNDWQLEGAKLLTVEEQKTLPFETAKLSPWNHYARKNLGYLYAISQGADLIYETDDDNLPYPTWQNSFPTSATTEAATYAEGEKYRNVYSYFTEARVWPRGFPLAEVARAEANAPATESRQISRAHAPILQGLADLEPDVDAIYRLTVGGQIKFAKKKPLFLNPGTYCPFNSQNTLGFPKRSPTYICQDLCRAESPIFGVATLRSDVFIKKGRACCSVALVFIRSETFITSCEILRKNSTFTPKLKA